MIVEVRLTQERSYSRTDESVRILHEWARLLDAGASEERLLVMFKAYFDESGIHEGAKICVIAGYLAPEKEWARFIPKWQAALDKYGISRFHANECNSNKGEFRKFKGKSEEKNALVIELLETIRLRRRIVPFFTYISVDDYDADFIKALGVEAKHPYYAGFVSVLTQIGLWLNFAKYPATEKVAMVFDLQNEFSKHALNLFNDAINGPYWEGQLRFGAIAFNSSDEDKPLQAADALAYEAYREVNRSTFNPERKPRPAVKSLIKGMKGYPWDADSIENFKERTKRGKST